MAKLAGIAEIAEILGVSRQRVVQLARTDSFPKPLQRLRMGPVWNLSEIEDWIGQRK